MEIVTSVQNRTVKLFRSLSEKKFREREGLFPVEGGNISKDIPPSAKVRFVLAVPERLGEAEERFPGAQVVAVADEVMKSVSGTVTPYGLAAAVELPHFSFAPPRGNALLLDGGVRPGQSGNDYPHRRGDGIQRCGISSTAPTRTRPKQCARAWAVYSA